MVIITVVISFVAIQHTKTMHKVNAFIAVGQEGIYTLSSNLSAITEESSEVLKRLEEETQFLAFRASSSIAKLTNASLAFKVFAQFLKKSRNKRGQHEQK